MRRVVGRRRRDGTRYQLLQERRWWGWKTVDHEEIPDHVLISLGCFGDTGGWMSKFADVIKRAS